MVQQSKFLIGVDEVGRGPLAGPVAVGVVKVPCAFNWNLLAGVTDSKQLTESRREAIVATAKQLQAAGQLRYEVSMVSAKVIDSVGIVPAINLAMERALKRVEQSRINTPVNWSIDSGMCEVRLDGGLRAPDRYSNQKTIIQGDAKEQVIGLASIVAKVHRDTYMRRLSKQPEYAPYSFTTHKGYGTKAHQTALQAHGLSSQHRRSFCSRYLT